MSDKHMKLKENVDEVVVDGGDEGNTQAHKEKERRRHTHCDEKEE